MAPGLVDAAGRDPVGHHRLQRAKERAVPEAGRGRRSSGCGVAGHRTRGNGRYLAHIVIDPAEWAGEPRNRVLAADREGGAVRAGEGVFDLRLARPAGGPGLTAEIDQLWVGVRVV